MNKPTANGDFRLGITGMLALVTGLLLQSEAVVRFILWVYEYLFSLKLNYPFRKAGLACMGQVCLATGLLFLVKVLFFKGERYALEKKFSIAAFALLIFYFLFRIGHDAVNVPIWDDYKTMLAFGNNWAQHPEITERLKLITAPFYESRMIMLRLVTALQLVIVNEINFRSMIMLSVVLYVLIFVLIFRASQLNGNKYFQLLPAAVFMFQFQSYDCLLWATSGFNFNLTILAGCASLYFICKKETVFFVLAVLCAVLASLTYGNGWIALLMLIPLLVYTKQGIRLSIVSVVILAAGMFYFREGIQLPFHAAGSTSWFYYPLYYFSFCGSAFRFFNNVWLAAGAGLLMNLWFLSMIRNWKTLNRPLLLMLVFIILSALLTTFYRTADGGPSQALSPRYGLYSQTLFICLLLLYTEQLVKSYHLLFLKRMLGLSLAYQVLTSFMFYPEAAVRRDILLGYIHSIEQEAEVTGKKLVTNPWIFGSDPNQEIQKAISAGIYRP